MKGISKFLTMAVAATALASCSDDLGLSNNSKLSKADLVATLETCEDGAITRLSAVDNGEPYGVQKIVWAPGEKVRVFTMNQLSQDLYQLTTGAGQTTGEFKQVVNNDLTGDKYAITEADMIYGVSAEQISDEVVKPLLTLTLPRVYTPGKDAQGNQKFPVPFWGEATVSGGATYDSDGILSEGAKLTTKITGLTAFLRVQLNELPAGTQYIVLTTHGGGVLDPKSGNRFMAKEEEGFLLAPFGTRVPSGAQDAKDFFYADDNGDGVYDNATLITGGYSEPLSGTLNTVLDKDDKDNSYLKIDSRLVHNDELIVKIDNNTPHIFYIPVVVGNYENLHVIAASHVNFVDEETTPTGMRYCYAGTELKVFQNEDFLRNHAYYLNMNLINLPQASLSAINQKIAQYNGTKGMTTIINVDDLGAYATVTGYPDDHIYVQKAGNLIINIKNIAADFRYGKTKNNPLLVSEAAAKNIDINDAIGSGTAVKDQKGFDRFVEVNVPEYWYTDATKATTNETEGFIRFKLPTYDVVAGTVDGLKAPYITADVLGPKTQLTEAIDLQNNSFSKQALDNESTWAIRIQNGFKNVNVLKNQTGDVYVHTNGVQAEEQTEVDSLDIQTLAGINIRLQDALIGAFKFSDTNNLRQVFTLSGTAIKNIYNYQSNKFEKADPQVNGVDYAGTADNTPAQVAIRAYWTGVALSPYAIQNGYDVSTVYTAAQLASVGEGLISDNESSTHGLDENESQPATNDYYIPKALVRAIWLGADDSYYPWIGAQATVSNFTFDGEGVELKNMTFLKNWAGANSSVIDPHWCCTTCWIPGVADRTISIKDNIGLIRSVINSDSVMITRVNLNDVDFDDTANNHNNVGAVVGYVKTKKAYLVDNLVGEDKINMKGNNVGGLAGEVIATENAVVIKNRVLGLSNKSGFVKSDGNYVGGAIGDINTPAAELTIEDNIVNLGQTGSTANGVVSGKNYVGGFVGYIGNKSLANLINNKVTVVNDIKATANRNAGGLVGYFNQRSNDSVNINKNEVTAKNITAKTNYAGGVVGSFVADDASVLTAEDDKVTVTNNITAGNDWAAGLVAYLKDDANVRVKDATISVTNTVKAGDKYAAGLIGQSELKAVNDTLWLQSAKVTVKNIEATNGLAGGEVGQAVRGTNIIGYDVEEVDGKYDTNIQITGALKGKYGVGGLVGNNATSNATPVFILTGIKDPATKKFYSHVVVNVKKFEQTKKVADFNGNTEKNHFGSISNILGLMQDDLTFNNSKETATNASADMWLDVTDNLTGEMKTDLLYKYHGGQAHTTVVDDPTAQLYWGDVNGYVGFRDTGIYTLSSDNNVKSDGETIDATHPHNTYRLNGENGATYNSYKSKLQ